MSSEGVIRVEGACQNNLKNLTFDLPLNQFVVVTGLSGSGKSSLAFDTLYAEGQRRYAETFSPYTRQFLERMEKPRADRITGIPPAIAISQANAVRTSRSTVGTMTEIADYLKLLFPAMAVLRCPHCGRDIKPWTADEVGTRLLATRTGETVLITFEIPFPEKTSREEIRTFLTSQGFLRHLQDGTVHRLDESDGTPFRAVDGQIRVEVVQDRLNLSPANRTRLLEALASAFRLGKNGIAIHPADRPGTEPERFSDRWHCPYDRVEFEPSSPGLFSFNNPVGACPVCRGFGRIIEIDYELALPDRNLSIAQGVVKPWQTESFAECQRDLLKACKKHGISTTSPFCELPPDHQRFVIDGEVSDTRSLEEIWQSGGWYGVKGFFTWLETKTYKMHVRILLSRYRAYRICPSCGGSRFQPRVHDWRLAGKTLPEINATPLEELHRFFTGLKPAGESAEILHRQITSRLGFLVQVGLGYLTLDRATRTLSGGEYQRVNLTTCLGTSLVGTLFVLDEPSIGLHPRDTGLLIRILQNLRDQGNSIVVVEHDESVMRAADHLLELGPKQGAEGGHLVFQGGVPQLLRSRTLTGDYLAGRRSIPLPDRRRPVAEADRLSFRDCSKHNIRNLSFDLPLRRFVAITGVSGSGKSTLVHEIIGKGVQQALNHPVDDPPTIGSLSGTDLLEAVTLVDQSPLTGTPRSTALLYLDVYDAVRELFASTEEARQSGLNASSFSFNSGDGRCDRCAGTGYERISMQFLSDLFVPCPVCEGKRFQKHVCAVPYLGKTIDQVLDLTVEEAIRFFNAGDRPKRTEELHAKIRSALSLLADVGLGYLRLGQPLSHLSGGEAQRLKLVSHLTVTSHGRGTGKTRLIILDEPTTGLHFDDIRLLVGVLQKLTDQGHSLVVIEHHMDVVACADWVIDLGPEAGARGGRIVAEGTPPDLARRGQGVTAACLAPRLIPARAPKTVNTGQPRPRKTPVKKDGGAIAIRGARHHNLKNISLDIPRNRIVVVTGLSGSGKSTLAFDLLFSEGQRRYLDCLNTYARQFVDQMERPDVDSITGIPPAVAIEQRTSRGGGKSTVATVTELYQFLRLLYAKVGVQHDPDTGEPAVRQSAEQVVTRLRALLRRDKELTLLCPLVQGRKGFHTEIAKWAEKKGFSTLRVDGRWIPVHQFKALDRYKEHTIDLVLGNIHAKTPRFEALVNEALRYGKGTFYTLDNRRNELIHSTQLYCPGTGRSFDTLDPRLFSFNSPHGWCPQCQGFGTIMEVDTDAETEAEREQQVELARENASSADAILCPSCQGARLNPVARAVRLGGIPVPEINRMTVREFSRFFRSLRFTGRDAAIVRDIRPEIEQRIAFLEKVGLDYLNLDRPAPTLSGGESQRIRLAAQLGSNLQGVLYVLDEPTIGLHPRDNEQLVRALRGLQQRGNSLVVVEHDIDTMREADHIIDLGPGAGIEGGQIIAQGSWRQLSKKKGSVTGMLLGQPLPHPLAGKRRPTGPRHPSIRLIGARVHNLRGVDVSFPLGRLSVVTGVSGAGKSSLLRRALLPAVLSSLARKKTTFKNPTWKSISGCEGLGGVVEVDQSPIGHTPRSTVATYIGLMDDLRKLFAQLPEARVRGFTAGHFSYNSGDGRCPACKGQGHIKVEMNFLPAAYIPCESCSGQRWTRAILDVRYQGKNIHDVLSMDIRSAVRFFSAHPRIATRLRLLEETGLGYLTIGQTSPTLSGGEAQRIKLVTELAAAEIRDTHETMRGRTTVKPRLYLLEEPTVGLHLADVKRLIELLHRLVDHGHTVIVIEHHLDLIAEADHVVEIGPGAADEGGRIVCTGTPEELVRTRKSLTGRYLAPLLPARRAAAKK
jgi:excinuclease ABC subunit A